MWKKLVGALLILMGGTWFLQGLDAFGQDGGMNGRPIWCFIGAVVVVLGVVLLVGYDRVAGRFKR